MSEVSFVFSRCKFDSLPGAEESFQYFRNLRSLRNLRFFLFLRVKSSRRSLFSQTKWYFQMSHFNLPVGSNKNDKLDYVILKTFWSKKKKHAYCCGVKGHDFATLKNLRRTILAPEMSSWLWVHGPSSVKSKNLEGSWRYRRK